MPKKDFSQVAFDVVQRATGEAPKTPAPTAKQEAGRKGGLSGGKARADALSKEQRSDIASEAAKARWAKKSK
jgi:hypothetical protein